jgi:osmotically inducible protein OsmC
MLRHASAQWSGDLETGSGTITGESGALDRTPYGFRTRFGDDPGTNPEELIAAAHAACFSMAFANELAKAGTIPESVATRAGVRLEMLDGGPTVTRVSLTTHAVLPGADENRVRDIAETAKTDCPVSRLLNAEITLTLSVET